MSIYKIGGYAIYWNFPGSAERLAVVPSPAEVNKIARQSNDNTLWLLVNANPLTWVAITAAASIPASFTQTFASSALWIINHNLGYEPNIQVLSTGGVELLTEVAHVSLNQATVTFATAQAGRIRAF